MPNNYKKKTILDVTDYNVLISTIIANRNIQSDIEDIMPNKSRKW